MVRNVKMKQKRQYKCVFSERIMENALNKMLANWSVTYHHLVFKGNLCFDVDTYNSNNFSFDFCMKCKDEFKRNCV